MQNMTNAKQGTAKEIHHQQMTEIIFQDHAHAGMGDYKHAGMVIHL